MPSDVELVEVIRTELDLRGDGEDVPMHRVEQYWSTDGELLAENCPLDDCDCDT